MCLRVSISVHTRSPHHQIMAAEGKLPSLGTARTVVPASAREQGAPASQQDHHVEAPADHPPPARAPTVSTDVTRSYPPMNPMSSVPAVRVAHLNLGALVGGCSSDRKAQTARAPMRRKWSGPPTMQLAQTWRATSEGLGAQNLTRLPSAQAEDQHGGWLREQGCGGGERGRRR